MTLALDVPWEWHAEVWVLIAGVVALGGYTAKVVQPKAVAAGYEPITRAQKTWFVLAVASMWAVSDWPVHEIAEQYLYFVHMFQHLFLSMLVPAMFVLATPRWLLELVIGKDSRAWRFLRTGSKPLVAALIFNAMTLLLHWSRLVQLSFDSGAAHFILHLMVFSSGLLMWMPVCGPIREWRLSPMGQCFYLFAMSIVPTVPGGWLVFAEDVVYRHYDTPQRLWGVGVLTDQQAAGVVMKLVGGFFLWAVIFVIFTRWAHWEMASDEKRRTERQQAARALAKQSSDTEPSIEGTEPVELSPAAPSAAAPATSEERAAVLTFEDVRRQFDNNPPPDHEH